MSIQIITETNSKKIFSETNSENILKMATEIFSINKSLTIYLPRFDVLSEEFRDSSPKEYIVLDETSSIDKPKYYFFHSVDCCCFFSEKVFKKFITSFSDRARLKITTLFGGTKLIYVTVKSSTTIPHRNGSWQPQGDVKHHDRSGSWG